MAFPPTNFCCSCGARVSLRTPPGDNSPRHVCDGCRTVHYRNPLMVIGTLPEWEDQVLLCRRAIEPRLGFWTLPGGFMELGETTAQAAVRETTEEAKARVELRELFSLLSVPHVDQVHLFYRARLLDLDFGPGEESLEVALFREGDIPWKDIAFRTTAITLKHYFADRRAGRFSLHTEAVLPLT
jgi:ADP-ribose pyrophosphatase YjhB (NUDIX family)